MKTSIFRFSMNGLLFVTKPRTKISARSKRLPTVITLILLILDDTADAVCIACASTHSPVVSAFDDSMQHHSFTMLSDSMLQVLSPLSSFVEIDECVINSDATFATYKVDGCAEYFKTVNGMTTHYGCLKCAWGQTGNGKLVDTDKKSLKNCFNYLNECDTDVRYHGLGFDFYNVSGTTAPLNWDSLLSCHKCVDSTKIPFLFLDSDNYPMQYSFYIEETMAFNSGTDGVIMRCIKPEKQAIELFLNYLVEDDFVINCGLGRVDTSSEKHNNQSLDNTQVTCIACLPGYKPTYATRGVTACQAISNCDYEQPQIWFNRCSSCKSGFAYEYNSTNKMANYDSCSAFSDVHCKVFSGSKCMFCQKGYMVSPDGSCRLFEVPNCSVDSTNQGTVYLTKGTMFSRPSYLFEEFGVGTTMYSDILFWQNPGKGCDSCKQDYFNVKENVLPSVSLRDISNVRADLHFLGRLFSSSSFSDLPINYLSSLDAHLCVKNISTYDYFISEDSYALDSVTVQFANMNRQTLILNCEKYALYPHSFKPICSVCKSGFIPNLDHSQCHSKFGSLENCRHAISSSKCAVCNDNFAMTPTKSCQALNISNCSEYAYLNTTFSGSGTSLRCISCKEGFFTTNGQSCQPIQIEGCLLAFDDQTCLKCSDGKYLFENGLVTECRDVGSEINCASAALDAKHNTMHCLDCTSSDFVVKVLDFTENTGKSLMTPRLPLPRLGPGQSILDFKSLIFHCKLCQVSRYYFGHCLAAFLGASRPFAFRSRLRAPDPVQLHRMRAGLLFGSGDSSLPQA